MSSVCLFLSYVYHDVDALNEFTDLLELIGEVRFLVMSTSGRSHDQRADWERKS